VKPVRKCRTIAGLVDRAMQLGAAARELERREALARIEALEQRSRAGPAGVFAPGDQVVLTATACRAWASVMGLPVTRSLTAVWTVTACDCALCQLGGHVCTDEPLAHELVDTDGPVLRHLAIGQVRRRGELRADDGLSTGGNQPSLGAAVLRATRRGGAR
jgi:hypothetical protein